MNQTGVLDLGHNGVTIRNGAIRGFLFSVWLIGASGTSVVGLDAKADYSYGIRVSGGSADTIRANDVVGRAGAIVIDQSPRARVLDNSALGIFGDYAISVSTDDGVIARNRATAEENHGLKVDGDGNRVVGNALPTLTIDGSGNVVARNWAVGGGSNMPPDGFTVPSTATDTILRDNIATGNAHDGFHIESPSTRLVRNVANANGNLGIDAVPGVVGIGNTATLNGDPAQCVGVTCG